MKLVISGSRYFTDYAFFSRTMQDLFGPSEDIEIVHGFCQSGTKTYRTKEGDRLCGVDGLAERYAEFLHTHSHHYPADWAEYDLAAGPIRNKEMAKFGDRAVIFWDGESKGSRNMIKQMQAVGKIYTVVPIKL